ncbi:GDP-mannose 4,6-dehydratase [Dactylosporangium roseum]|uniref:GDP-mannose 4,6-dehydratase n=1 Tax=Dactylosporangium roseum TaxID=47989 RepID=UPI0021B4A278|nr:GDP-mannose 4,6-dehydratase [Dactylosporangium roseum]
MLITGITGQDGVYLAEQLLSEGYQVFGVVRGQRSVCDPNRRPLRPEIKLLSGDLLDQSSLIAAVETAQPDEVYNLGALSFVPVSWRQSNTAAQITGVGVLRILEAVRVVAGVTASVTPGANCPRFYQASSSEMFGKVRRTPQNEQTVFHPRSPYGVAKVFGHYMVQNYRESYGMFAVSGILFNHESPLRGPQFVTRRVSLAAAAIKLGLHDELRLGNLDAQRDWGFAGDYVRGMVQMLAQDRPEDFVLGTGVTNSVRELVDLAFRHVGLDWRDYVRADPGLLRPAEVDSLCADSSRARQKLGWKPEVSFEELVAMMVDADLRLLSDDREMAAEAMLATLR